MKKKNVKKASSKDMIRREALNLFEEELDRKLRRMREGMVIEVIVSVELVKSGTLRETKEYREWRKRVFERDNGTCVDCGSKDNMHAHHIVPFQYDPFEKGIDINNGVVLCGKCHRARHKKNR